MADEVETIVALATPPGRGGIAVVRISGAEARTLLAPMLRLRRPLAAGRVRTGELLDGAGAPLDQVVVTLYVAPHSYTGDDVVEVAMHGAPVLVEYVLRAALERGARLAEPGEFTRRALLNGKMDLTQAEAVHDLVEASTLEQARVAAAQLGGALARQVAPAKDALLDLIAELEAGIDFAEDDLAVLAAADVEARLQQVRQPLALLAESFGYGRRLHEGARLAIVGQPNAGKSSLFNGLLCRQRAIVTAQPGTTRDLVADRLAIGGVPVELVDTAGLRGEVTDAAEREGIRRSRVALAEADLVLVVVDGGVGMAAEDEALLDELAGRPHLLVINKLDLLRPETALSETAQPERTRQAIFTSAVTGAGIDELRAAIARILLGEDAVQISAERGVLTNLRQQTAVMEALAALEASRQGLAQAMPHEFLLLDLAQALGALDALTGATLDGEVLGRIFSRFCIGK